MSFWSFFRTRKWIMKNGVRTTATITDCTHKEEYHGEDLLYVYEEYTFTAEGYNPVSKKTVKFRWSTSDARAGRFALRKAREAPRFTKGQTITIYVHPEEALRWERE